MREPRATMPPTKQARCWNCPSRSGGEVDMSLLPDMRMSGFCGRSGRKNRCLLNVERAMRYMSRYWLDTWWVNKCVLGRYSNAESKSWAVSTGLAWRESLQKHSPASTPSENLLSWKDKWSPEQFAVRGHIPGRSVRLCVCASWSVTVWINEAYFGSPVTWLRRMNSMLKLAICAIMTPSPLSNFSSVASFQK